MSTKLTRTATFKRARCEDAGVEGIAEEYAGALGDAACPDEAVKCGKYHASRQIAHDI